MIPSVPLSPPLSRTRPLGWSHRLPAPLVHGATWAIVLGATVATLGCAGFKPIRTGDYRADAAANFRAGAERMLEREYEDAKRYFTLVRTEFPISRFAALAQLWMADAAREQEQAGAEIVDLYQGFLRDHPTHACAPYARFRLSEGYFDKMPEDIWILPPAHEKDSRNVEYAREALSNFIRAVGGRVRIEVEADRGQGGGGRIRTVRQGEADVVLPARFAAAPPEGTDPDAVIEEFLPDPEADPEVKRSDLGHCLDRDEAQLRAMVRAAVGMLAEVERRLWARELYVAGFYRREERPRGVIGRIEPLRERFPRVYRRPDVRLMLAEAYDEANDPRAALAVYEALMEESPDTSEANRARKRLPVLREKVAALPAPAADSGKSDEGAGKGPRRPPPRLPDPSAPVDGGEGPLGDPLDPNRPLRLGQ